MSIAKPSTLVTRRNFLTASTAIVGGLLTYPFASSAANIYFDPKKKALVFYHFPHPVYAFIWRNWTLVPINRISEVLNTDAAEVLDEAKKLGLSNPPPISEEQFNRSYLTVIRRNWHLLPEEQLLILLGWTKEQLEFTLVEDDFFYVKLGNLKPECAPLSLNDFKKVDPKKLDWFRQTIRQEFPDGLPTQQEPYFAFVKQLSQPPKQQPIPTKSGFNPRFGYAYFALFGDPLLETSIDPYPDGYLDRMVDSGMDGTWMHIVLSKLTPFPWEPSLSEHWETRLKNLKALVEKTAKKGIGIYLYLNEPRNQTEAFFKKYPHLKGAGLSLCTSHPEVRKYLADSIATIVEQVPGIAGFFSITASENRTNCWSHGKGNECPRCAKEGPANVIASLNRLYNDAIQQGMKKHDSQQQPSRLIAWDWGWKDGWAEDILPQMPKTSALMSVSEWNLPIERGGITSQVGEYSISAVGPGPRAIRHWNIAKKNGLQVLAKIQAGNTWEIAAVPYIPALENVGNHIANLRKQGVDGIMLGWTLGGYPSPNLELVALLGSNPTLSPAEAMQQVAQNRYGAASTAVVKAWQAYSAAFREFPYNIGVVYNAPLQAGPSNLLWQKPTGYKATMVGLGYDDLKNWRSIYPEGVFIQQLYKVAEGFQKALKTLHQQTQSISLEKEMRHALVQEMNVAETVAIHYESIANQACIIQYRDTKKSVSTKSMADLLTREIALAKRMATLQCADSRLGFEASNHYFYVPADLVEKVVNCRYLLEKWT